MKKEQLLRLKQNERDNMVWYLKDVFSDDDLRKFSLSQLKVLVELSIRAETFREKTSPFFTLSATEVLQKESGRIAEFGDNITEISGEEIMRSASSEIYKRYCER